MNRGEYTSFEIKVGGVYKLVGCLTAAPMSESAETIQTTTRENNGWTTELPTNQSYEISLEGLAKKDGVNLPGNMISYFVLREMKRARQIIEYRIVNLDGWFVDKGKAIITEIGYTDTAGEFVTFSATLRGFGKPTGQLVNPDATQVAGRNLFIDGAFLKGFNTIPEKTENTDAVFRSTDIDKNPNEFGHNFLNILSTSGGDRYAWLSQFVKVVPLTNYTISFYQIGAGGIKGNSSYIQLSNGKFIPIIFDIDNQKKLTRFSFTFNTQFFSGSFRIRFGFVSNTGAWISVSSLKVERGSIATPWTPAPEDI